MERQGIFRGFQIVSGYSFVWVVLAVLFLSVSGWGRCIIDYCSNCVIDVKDESTLANSCNFPELSCSGPQTLPSGPQVAAWVPHPSYSQSCYAAGFSTCQAHGLNATCYYPYRKCIAYICNTTCETDSVRCVNAGKDWNSAACQCSDPCDNYRTQCESLGGEFEGRAINKPGSPGTRCCNGVCNLCTTKASEEQWEKKKYYCCSQNLAPPKMNTCGIDSPPVGCGVSTKFKTNSDNGACRSPNLSEEASQSFYENCSGGSSSSAESSSSGGTSSGGGSSGNDGSSSSGIGPYPEGCDECPWLDSILDTLIATKGILQGVEDCLENAVVCMNIQPGGDTNDYSGYLDSIIILLDSALSNDKYSINLLGNIDSSLLEMLDKETVTQALLQAGLKNDTNIRRTLADGNYNVDTNFISLKKAIYDLDTATIHHLDSIVKHLPDSILDSIRKYQDSALDRFDSALWGKGVGFSLIDSMIDSVVKYFQVSNHYDSAYAVMFGESMDRLMSKMDDMSFGIDGNLSFQVELDYGPLGYGDTASVTLRDDINRMREDITNAILDIDTSVGNELKELVEEQKGFYIFSTGYGISGSSTLKSDLAGIKGSVDAINERLGEGSYDTSTVYDGYLNGYDTSAVNFTNDLAGALNVALQDSSYANIFGSSSSVGSSGSDGSWVLPNVDSAHQVLRANVDSSLQSITANMENIFDTLKREFVLVNWDSAIIAPLGMKVPNTNTCPEDCFAINLNSAGGIFANMQSFNWGLCRTYPILGGLNVMQFIRLVLRIVTAFACVYIGMWFIAGKRD